MPETSRSASPRLIAIVLAAGGLFFGFALLMIFGPLALIFPPTAAGYAITAGYLVRAAGQPTLGWRYTIWAASILVQGAWLLAALPGILRAANPADDLLIASWWAFAAAASIVALVGERD